jgi:hypothetical protein
MYAKMGSRRISSFAVASVFIERWGKTFWRVTMLRSCGLRCEPSRKAGGKRSSRS